jgi:hypothetical protein
MSMLRRLPLSLVSLSMAALALAADPPKEAKLTADDVVARHVASIGTAEAQSAAGGRVVKGPVQYVRKPVTNDESDPFAGRTTNITVPMTLASGGARYFIDIQYGGKDYPFDRIVYDGNKVKNARLFAPGNYTVIAGLLKDNDWLLKSGLLGGPLTTAWILLSPGERFEKLDYAGIKKGAGKPGHRLNARLRGDSEHEIAFYFDPETFQLFRTEIWIGPNARRKLEQDFSDYKTVHDLSLPHSWTMTLDAPQDRWQLKVAEVHVASELPEQAFKLD